MNTSPAHLPPGPITLSDDDNVARWLDHFGITRPQLNYRLKKRESPV